MPLSYQVKTSRSHKPCSKLHSFWKHSHLGLGGVRALTHQGGKLWEQPIFKNSKGVYLLPNVKCYRDVRIPENKVPFHVLPRALGFENQLYFTKLAFQVFKSQINFSHVHHKSLRLYGPFSELWFGGFMLWPFQFEISTNHKLRCEGTVKLMVNLPVWDEWTT